MVKMVGEVLVELVREVVVHLTRHCHHYHPLPYLHPILPYPPPPILTHHSILPYTPILTHHPILLYPNKFTHHLPYPQRLTHQSRLPLHMSSYHYHQYLPLYRPHLLSSVSLEPDSMVVDITLSSPNLPSPTLPPIDETDETMVYLV